MSFKPLQDSTDTLEDKVLLKRTGFVGIYIVPERKLSKAVISSVARNPIVLLLKSEIYKLQQYSLSLDGRGLGRG